MYTVPNISNNFIEIPVSPFPRFPLPFHDLHLHRQALCLCEVLVSEGSRRTGWDTGLGSEIMGTAIKGNVSNHLSFGWRKLRLQNFRKVIPSYYLGGMVFCWGILQKWLMRQFLAKSKKQLSKESELVQFPVTSALYLPCWGLAFGNLQHSRYPSTWIGIAKCQVSSNISNSMVCTKVLDVCGNMMQYGTSNRASHNFVELGKRWDDLIKG